MSGPLDLLAARRQAEQLKGDLAAGEPGALERVLASHPKLAGRPAELLEGFELTLRDAQATVARELGFESWAALLAEADASPRWDPSGSEDVMRRAFAQATNLRQGFCTDLHLLLAVLEPPSPSAAGEVLAALGLTPERVRERLSAMDRPRRRAIGVRSTPRFHATLGWAEGLAAGMGAGRLSDDHVLLALLYGDGTGESTLVSLGIDPDEVVAALRARGMRTPPVAPPAAPPPTGPLGRWVYFPVEDLDAVTTALGRERPPATAHWGTNSSKWKRGYWWVHGKT